MDGRLPPLPPLIVGLLVTGMLAALGLQSLPGILLLTPVEAMLLASLASWHPHDGRRTGWCRRCCRPASTCSSRRSGSPGMCRPRPRSRLLAAVALYHLDLAYRARNELVPSQDGPFVREEGQLSYSDRAGFGWDGRMIVRGLAAVAGIAPVIYPLLALYLVVPDGQGLAGRLVSWTCRRRPLASRRS